MDETVTGASIGPVELMTFKRVEINISRLLIRGRPPIGNPALLKKNRICL
jgi:hypothetical protein